MADAPVRHHDFPPSKMALYEQCPGAWALGRTLPQDYGKDNEYAAEGTMLHERVASGDLSGLTEEQASAVRFCLQAIEDYKAGHVGDFQRMNEVQVELLDDDNDEITFGTVDCLLVNRKPEYRVWGCVMDWKFGLGEVPEAADNLQIAIYASALARRNNMAVEAMIVQPRLHKVSSFVYEPDLADAVAERVEGIIEKCETHQDEFVLGPHCASCPARCLCQKQRETAAVLAKRASSAESVLALRQMPDDQLGLLYAQTVAVSKFSENVKEEVLRRMDGLDGSTCGGWRLKVKSGGYSVKDAAAAFDRVRAIIPGDVFASLCTVTLAKLKAEYAQRAVAVGLAKTKKEGEMQAFEVLKPVLEPRSDVFTLTPDK